MGDDIDKQEMEVKPEFELILDASKDQHMLLDVKIIKKEVELAEVTGEDRILEIGAGRGNLTLELARNAGQVVAFENDVKFKGILDGISRESKKIKIVYGNALQYSWKSYNKIVSNIPYSISEPLINKAVQSRIKLLVLIMGENFKKLLDKEDTKPGFIANLFYKIGKIQEISPESFNPKPRVKSWLLKFEIKNNPNSIDRILQNFILREGKIKNSLIFAFTKEGKTKNQAREIISRMKLNEIVLEKPVKKATGKLLVRLREEIERNKNQIM